LALAASSGELETKMRRLQQTGYQVGFSAIYSWDQFLDDFPASGKRLKLQRKSILKVKGRKEAKLGRNECLA